MLQLLLERGQSYEDIASLLDVDVDEVRSRARAALAELSGQDPDGNVELTDYMLGQADPIGRADAVRHLQSDPDALSLASDLEAKLRMIAPQAQLPQLPRQRSGRGGRLRRRREPAPASAGDAAPSDEAAAPPGGRLGGTLSRSQQRMILVFGLIAVLAIAGVLAVTGAFSGGGEESSSAGTTTSSTSTSTGNDQVVADVGLKPQGGSDAKGKATFGIASGDQAYLQLDLENVSPSPQGRTYVLWLLLSPNQGYPLSPLEIGQNGTFSDRFPIPQFAVPIASRARFVDVSLTENAKLQQQLPKAVKQGNPLLTYSGESIARGAIPASQRNAQGAQGGQANPGG